MPFRRSSMPSVSMPRFFRVGFSSDTDQYLVGFDCLSLSVLFHNHAVGCDFDDFLSQEKNSTPFLVYSDRSIADISLSIAPSISGIISITFTLTPMLLKKEANSIPITPPPIIAIDREVLSHPVLLSKSSKQSPTILYRWNDGFRTGTKQDILYRKNFLAALNQYISVFPLPRITASPCMIVTPLPFSLALTPSVSFLTVLFLRAIILLRSKPGALSAWIPYWRHSLCYPVFWLNIIMS